MPGPLSEPIGFQPERVGPRRRCWHIPAGVPARRERKNHALLRGTRSRRRGRPGHRWRSVGRTAVSQLRSQTLPQARVGDSGSCLRPSHGQKTTFAPGGERCPPKGESAEAAEAAGGAVTRARRRVRRQASEAGRPDGPGAGLGTTGSRSPLPCQPGGAAPAPHGRPFRPTGEAGVSPPPEHFSLGVRGRWAFPPEIRSPVLADQHL